ncbi:MAG: hypothetical protein ABIO67_02590 [Mycobacteriales bacterium]
MHPEAISAALKRYGVVDLSQLGAHSTRAAARHGLVLVQSGAGVAASQPICAHQLMYATALAVPESFAFLSGARRLRAALVAAGVAGLRSEVRLASAGGGSCYLDLLHDPSCKALELDGGYHDLPAQRRVDRHRDRWIRREHNIEVIRVADEEVRRDLPGLVVELLPHFGV